MSTIFALASKDLKLLWRDKMSLFFVLVFPVLYAILFGSVFGGDGETARMSIAIVDHDRSAQSRLFTEQLRESDALTVFEYAYEGRRYTHGAAINTLRTLDADLTDDQCAEILDAHEQGFTALAADGVRNLVRRGQLVAFVEIAEGYGSQPGGVFGAGSESAMITVGIDPSRKAEAGYLQGLLVESSFAVIQDMFSDPAMASEQVQSALSEIDSDDSLPLAQRLILKTFLGSIDTFLNTVDPDVYAQAPMFSGVSGADADGDAAGDESDDSDVMGMGIEFVEVATSDVAQPTSPYEVTFPSAIMWGVLGCAAAFAISIVIERTTGTFTRLEVAPMTSLHILGGKALACFTVSVTVIMLLLTIGHFAFGVRLGNPGMLALAVTSTSLCFVGITMLLSVLGTTEQAVGGIGWAVNVVLAMLGGAMMPLIAMPAWMLKVSSVSPVKWAIYSMEGAIWRNFSMSEMVMPVGILLAVGAVCFAIGTTVLLRSRA